MNTATPETAVRPERPGRAQPGRTQHGRALAGLAAWLAFTFTAAAGGLLIDPGDWYATLNKPAWTPPAWLFGPNGPCSTA